MVAPLPSPVGRKRNLDWNIVLRTLKKHPTLSEVEAAKLLDVSPSTIHYVKAQSRAAARGEAA